jgi:hypothetical protein
MLVSVRQRTRRMFRVQLGSVPASFVGLPLTAAANAAKLSCKPLISLSGAP